MVVGVTWPHSIQPLSLPFQRRFWTTIYSTQSCSLVETRVSTGWAPLLGCSTLLVAIDWRLVTRTTIWRMPELASSGMDVARSDMTRRPRKLVLGLRRYLTSVHSNFSDASRAS